MLPLSDVFLRRTAVVLAVLALSGLLLYSFSDSSTLLRLSATTSSLTPTNITAKEEPETLEQVSNNNGRTNASTNITAKDNESETLEQAFNNNGSTNASIDITVKNKYASTNITAKDNESETLEQAFNNNGSTNASIDITVKNKYASTNITAKDNEPETLEQAFNNNGRTNASIDITAMDEPKALEQVFNNNGHSNASTNITAKDELKTLEQVFNNNDGTNASKTITAKDEPKTLEQVLKAAATEDGTVIITSVNEAWTTPNSLLDLFLESFRIGNSTRRLLNHLIVVAVDRKAYERCLEVHKHCFTLVTEGIDFHKEAGFMSPIYLRMMWRRTEFLQSILQLGYNFVFTDADIMWFRDPFPRFHPDTDFQIACDMYFGNPEGMNNLPNGGFLHVKSNNQTLEFYKFWLSGRETYLGKNEQDVLNIIKFDPFLSEIGFRLKFLDTAFFGGFCQSSKDLNLVCTMHANCCVGLDKKVNDLRLMLKDWRAFMSLPEDLKKDGIVNWRVPQKCRRKDPKVQPPS